MIKIENIVRKNILELQPYSTARDEFSQSDGIFLDANENPFGLLNRYPDPRQKELKTRLAKLKNIVVENIFVSNGSDEVIDLAFRIFCNPGLDKALAFTPTYGMYDVSAAINNVQLLKIPLTKEFQIDLEKLNPFLTDSSIKLLFICSPNNPTGNLIRKQDVEFILTNFNGMVILDEAYIDFAENASLIHLVNKYNNLIISQTLSKAWGLAAARVGLAYTNEEVIRLYNKVKAPYNVSELNQKAALTALENIEYFQENLKTILSEKDQLIMALKELDFVKKIYPSDANFLLVEMQNAEIVYAALVEQQIIVRNRNKEVKNCIRVTIGTPQENKELLKALKTIQ